MGLFRLFFVHWVTEDVSKPENVATPPVCEVEESEKAFWKLQNPVLHLKMPILGLFTAHLKAFLRVAVRGRKWGHLGRKIDFFVFDPESDL